MKINFFIIFFLLFLVNTNNIINIPLKTFQKIPNDFFTFANDKNINNDKDNNNSNSNKYFIDQLIDSSLYSYIKIGEPEYKIKLIPSTLNPYLSMTYQFISQNGNNIKYEYEYDVHKSKTFKNISATGKYFIRSYRDIKATERIKINIFNYNNNITKEINVDDMNFILEVKNLNKKKNTDTIKIYNLNIGLQILHDNKNSYEKYNYTFIYQLKRKKIINNYHWSVFFEKGKNKKGKNLYNANDLINTKAELIIGDYPDKYKPNILDENQLMTIKSNYLYWNLYFSNIYYFTNSTINKKQIIPCPNTELSFNSFQINAPMTYYIYINNHYFKKYINDNLCHNGYSGELLFLYCDKSEKFNINELEKFPTLYFQHDELDYTFELTYEDLFTEKDNKFWFLVCFESYYEIDKWFLGNIFLRKYYFVFNQDSKTIGFYNLNLPRKLKTKVEKEKEREREREIIFVNKKMNLKYIIIILCLGSFLFIYIGIAITKKIYKKYPNKKKALELNEEYENNKDINQQENKGKYMEMKYSLIKS